jgi:hypothetical protein
MLTKDKIKAAAQLLEAVRIDLEEDKKISLNDAYEMVTGLLTEFCCDEWSEVQCEYLRRKMLDEIYCYDCGAEMPKEQIMYRHCDTCHEEQAKLGWHDKDYRRKLEDV